MNNWHLTRITHLSPKGQLTIPVAIQRALGLKARDALGFAVRGRTLIITPVRKTNKARYDRTI